jgi:hypothetical protein
VHPPLVGLREPEPGSLAKQCFDDASVLLATDELPELPPSDGLYLHTALVYFLYSPTLIPVSMARSLGRFSSGRLLIYGIIWCSASTDPEV